MLRFVFAVCCAIVICGFAAAGETAPPLVSAFDVDAEGWTVRGNEPSQPDGGTLTHVATGGNPGGFVQIEDLGEGTYAAVAPTKFLGDRLEYQGGMISFDARAIVLGVDPEADSFGVVTIAGAGDAASLDLAVPPLDRPTSSDWRTFSAPLTAAAWGKTKDEWTSILSDVTGIEVTLEFFDDDNSTAFDNFQLAPR